MPSDSSDHLMVTDIQHHPAFKGDKSATKTLRFIHACGAHWSGHTARSLGVLGASRFGLAFALHGKVPQGEGRCDEEIM